MATASASTRSSSGDASGRTERNEIVHLPAQPDAGAGALVEVEIARANKHSLEGRVLRVMHPAAAAPVAPRRVGLPVVSA